MLSVTNYGNFKILKLKINFRVKVSSFAVITRWVSIEHIKATITMLWRYIDGALTTWDAHDAAHGTVDRGMQYARVSFMIQYMYKYNVSESVLVLRMLITQTCVCVWKLLLHNSSRYGCDILRNERLNCFRYHSWGLQSDTILSFLCKLSLTVFFKQPTMKRTSVTVIIWFVNQYVNRSSHSNLKLSSKFRITENLWHRVQSTSRRQWRDARTRCHSLSLSAAKQTLNCLRR